MNFRRAFFLFLLFLTACAKTIPAEVLTDVDRTVSFQVLHEHPGDFVGKTVLLGGTIIRTENAPGKTTLIVLQHALDDRMKPLGADRSEGRFIVIAEEFLDPAIYAPGRRITMTGTVTGQKTRPLNGIPYVYPTLRKRFLYLWPEETVPVSEPRVYFGIGIGIGNYHF